MSMEAILPNGQVQMLNHVANFDFNWHVNSFTLTIQRPCYLPAQSFILLRGMTIASTTARIRTQLSGWAGVSAASTKCITLM